MCLTIPGKIVKVEAGHATVDYGKFGTRENVSTRVVHVELGDYVLVQGGFVIKVLEAKEAEETLETWKEVEKHLGESDGGLF